MLTTERPCSNWLASIAAAAGYEHSRLYELEATASRRDAWEIVTTTCGITEAQLLELVADRYGLPRANFEVAERHSIRLVPEKVAKKYLVVPIREDDRTLIVATSDPRDLETEEALRFASGRAPRFELATPRDIDQQIEQRYSGAESLNNLLSTLGEATGDVVRLMEEDGPESIHEQDVESAPVVQLTNFIVRTAVKEGASDIHVEPNGSGGVVRLRIDGVLRNYLKLPPIALSRVVSRIKIMGRLDITDRLRPHDGRARVLVSNQAYDLRISTVPTRDSEKAVVRILNPRATSSLEDLALPPHELARMRQLFAYRDGIVLVTGPTGSGKTTTIYGAIREMATGERNIMSVEDPIEYDVPGVTQMQVEPKRGVTFPSALRAILRQDPDVVFVGEIRDHETAEIAVQASMTGHLVVATLHTNDAVSSVARLIDLGLDRSAIANTLRGAIAQRLVRRLCGCAVETNEGLDAQEAHFADVFGVQPPMRTKGCTQCGHSGYRGRFAVTEVLVVSEELERLIGNGASALELDRAASNNGMRPMLEVALERVRSGETTLSEVARVLGEATDAPVRATQEADRPSRVLIVEDDPINRLVVTNLLRRNGFEVFEAEDGLKALSMVKTPDEFDLVVLDLNMPRMGGEEVLRRLKSAPRTACVPVVVLTASGDDHAEARLIEAGAEDYIRKPLDPSRFMARARAAIRRAVL